MDAWLDRSAQRYCWYSDIAFRGQPHLMNSGQGAILPIEQRNTASSLRTC